MKRKVRDWWRKHFLGAELVSVLAAVGGLSIWMYFFGGTEDIDALLDSRRGAIYGVLASVLGSLLGFVIATLAIVVGLASLERLTVVRASDEYEILWKTFMSCIWSLGLGTLAAIAALVGDRGSDPVMPLFLVAFGSGLLAAARLARCIWILDALLTLVRRPAARLPGA